MYCGSSVPPLEEGTGPVQPVVGGSLLPSLPMLLYRGFGADEAEAEVLRCRWSAVLKLWALDVEGE